MYRFTEYPQAKKGKKYETATVTESLLMSASTEASALLREYSDLLQSMSMLKTQSMENNNRLYDPLLRAGATRRVELEAHIQNRLLLSFLLEEK